MGPNYPGVGTVRFCEAMPLSLLLLYAAVWAEFRMHFTNARSVKIPPQAGTHPRRHANHCANVII